MAPASIKTSSENGLLYRHVFHSAFFFDAGSYSIRDCWIIPIPANLLVLRVINKDVQGQAAISVAVTH